MAADEFGRRMHHDICAMFHRPDEIGRSKGVVDNERQAVAVSNGSNGVDIRDIAVGIAQGFQIDGPGVLFESRSLPPPDYGRPRR